MHLAEAKSYAFLPNSNGVAKKVYDSISGPTLRCHPEITCGVTAGGLYINVPFAGKFEEREILVQFLRREVLNRRPEVRFIRIFVPRLEMTKHL